MPKIFSPWWAELFEKCFISLSLITLRKSIQKIMPNILLSNRQFQVKSNSEVFSWYSHTGYPCQPIHSLFLTPQFCWLLWGRKGVLCKAKAMWQKNISLKWQKTDMVGIWTSIFVLRFFYFNSSHLWINVLSPSSPIKRIYSNRSSLQNIFIPEKKNSEK